MKKTALAALMGFASVAGTQAHAAATATGTFDVSITLTSKCEINNHNGATGAVIDDLAMNYTSFQTTAATGSTRFNVRCTDGIGYALALDTQSATDDVLDLAYTLELSASSGMGTGVDQEVTVTGTILANQAGTCAAGSCANAGATNRTRTLTVTY